MAEKQSVPSIIHESKAKKNDWQNNPTERATILVSQLGNCNKVKEKEQKSWSFDKKLIRKSLG